MSQLSRRSFLKSSAVGAGAVGFSQLFGFSQVFAQGEGDDPQTILDLAATAETFACVHYFSAIQSAAALSLTDDEVRNLKTFLDAELKHKQFLEANGATPLATEFFVPENLFMDRDLFVQTSNTAENWFIAAYLAATRRFAELGNPLLAATAAQVSGVEAEHQALLRQMGGLVPSNQALKQPLFYNTSEVVPLFQPFLEGGDGFVGPAAFPGVEAINGLVGDEGVTIGTPFIQLDGQGTMSMEDDSAMMMGEGACTVQATNTNIRQGPSTTTDIVGKLSDGNPMEVVGRTMDVNGFTWLQIDQGWVRSDVVTIMGDCASVAVM